jgi:hypothetical protein
LALKFWIKRGLWLINQGLILNARASEPLAITSTLLFKLFNKVSFYIRYVINVCKVRVWLLMERKTLAKRWHVLY